MYRFKQKSGRSFFKEQPQVITKRFFLSVGGGGNSDICTVNIADLRQNAGTEHISIVHGFDDFLSAQSGNVTVNETDIGTIAVTDVEISRGAAAVGQLSPLVSVGGTGLE